MAREIRGQKEEEGILLPRLYLLAMNEGRVASRRGLRPTGLGQGGVCQPLTKELGDQRVLQTRGATQMHKRHTKLEKSLPRERHNKSYTREKRVGGGDSTHSLTHSTQPNGNATRLQPH